MLCGRIAKLEDKYRVGIVPVTKGEERVIIHALTNDEGEQCWNTMEHIINDSLIISDTISVSCLQVRYLEAKHNKVLLEARRQRGVELCISQPNSSGELCDISIKGTVNQVNKIGAKLRDLVKVGYRECQFDIQIPSIYSSMWMKRWQQVKNEQEALHNIIIEFKLKLPSPDASNGAGITPDTTTATFVMCGDSKAIESIKTTICTKESGNCIEQRVVKLPSGGAAEVNKGLQQNKIVGLSVLVVEVNVNEPFNTVTISSPQEALSELKKAEDIVVSFVNNQKETISLTDPIIGLILASPEYSSKMNDIAQPHCVKVLVPKYPSKELTLTGNQSALDAVMMDVQLLLKSICQDIEQVSIVVDMQHDSVIENREFVRFCETLQDELYVSCAHGYRKNNKIILKPILVQPIQSSHCVKLEIVQGSILNEYVDAIVNDSNENLQHTEGLSRSISDAGGPTIQLESDMYIQKHGKLKSGDAVCLGGGGLLCRRLIHVAWPPWDNTIPIVEQATIYRSTIINVLKLAEEEKMNCVSFSISNTGIVMYAQALIEAIKMFVCTNILKVRCVLPDSPSEVNEFISALRSVYPEHFNEQEEKEKKEKKEKEEEKEVKINTDEGEEVGSGQQEQSNSSGAMSYFLNLWSAIKGEDRMSVPNARRSSDVMKSEKKVERGSGRQRGGQQSQHPQRISSNVGTPVLPHSESWLWQDDFGSFLPYPSNVCKILSMEYAKNSNGSASCTIDEHHYTIDFLTMTQTNVATKRQRKIQRNPSAPGASGVQTPPAVVTHDQGVQWYYQDDDGQFTPYTPNHSIAIHSMYTSKVSGEITINGNTYTFDFSTLNQINIKTNHRRPIKLQIISKVPTTIIEATGSDTIIVLTLRGLKGNLPTAKARINSMLESAYAEKSVLLPLGDQGQLEEKLKEVAKKYQVVYSVRIEGQGRKVFRVEGFTSSVSKAVTAIQEEIIHWQATSEEAPYPPEWQPQGGQTTQLFPLTEKTTEWNRVADKFRRTMPPNTRIIAINRIQNTWLWGRYVQHRKRLHLKNNGVVNEMELFHGTRNNDPKLIYEGEDGFDMRYCAQGMWGVANYFAVNASYSDSYAHHITTSRQKEMFLVKVLTGESYNCAPDGSLRMPPPKPSGGTGASQVELCQMKYDTVTGMTNGSQVFMAYDNEKAYPAYLITYT